MRLQCLVILVASTLSGYVSAFEFRPNDCRLKDQGSGNYVSLGETVLRIPAHSLTVTNFPPQDALSYSAPDPNEPLGCRNNPLPQQSLIISFALEHWLENKGDATSAPLEYLSFINANPDFWGINSQKSHTTSCEKLTQRVQLKNGLEGCIGEPTEKRAKYLQAGSYIAPLSLYKAPFDKPFVISCRPALPEGVRCSVSYKIQRTVNILYTFESRKVDLEDAINLDKKIRENFYNSVVADYKWK